VRIMYVGPLLMKSIPTSALSNFPGGLRGGKSVVGNARPSDLLSGESYFVTNTRCAQRKAAEKGIFSHQAACCPELRLHPCGCPNGRRLIK